MAQKYMDEQYKKFLLTKSIRQKVAAEKRAKRTKTIIAELKAMNAEIKVMNDETKTMIDETKTMIDETKRSLMLY